MSIPKYLAIMGALDLFILAGKLYVNSNLKAGFLNPPLGRAAELLLPLCLALCVGISTVLPLSITRRMLSTTMYVAIASGLISMGLYTWTIERYGRVIDIPTRNISDFLIV